MRRSKAYKRRRSVRADSVMTIISALTEYRIERTMKMVCFGCGKLPTPQDGRTENRPGEWQQCEKCGEWFCPDCAEESGKQWSKEHDGYTEYGFYCDVCIKEESGQRESPGFLTAYQWGIWGGSKNDE